MDVKRLIESVVTVEQCRRYARELHNHLMVMTGNFLDKEVYLYTIFNKLAELIECGFTCDSEKVQSYYEQIRAGIGSPNFTYVGFVVEVPQRFGVPQQSHWTRTDEVYAIWKGMFPREESYEVAQGSDGYHGVWVSAERIYTTEPYEIYVSFSTLVPFGPDEDEADSDDVIEAITRLPGQKKRNPEDFDVSALAAGIKIEMEHTSSRAVARAIAMDHLDEDPEYYVKLKKVER